MHGTTTARRSEPLGLFWEADGIAIAWQDPSAPDDARAGRVPILPRALLLSLAQLSHGRYRLAFTVAAPGKAPDTGTRSFTLIP